MKDYSLSKLEFHAFLCLLIYPMLLIAINNYLSSGWSMAFGFGFLMFELNKGIDSLKGACKKSGNGHGHGGDSHSCSSC